MAELTDERLAEIRERWATEEPFHGYERATADLLGHIDALRAENADLAHDNLLLRDARNEANFMLGACRDEAGAEIERLRDGIHRMEVREINAERRNAETYGLGWNVGVRDAANHLSELGSHCAAEQVRSLIRGEA